jgi:hypothetical protein
VCGINGFVKIGFGQSSNDPQINCRFCIVSNRFDNAPRSFSMILENASSRQ